ncbi:hypothetical protein SLA2020_139130 [Shorea laevis]
MGKWEEGVWQWELKWRRKLFAWEDCLLQEMVAEIQNASLKQGTQDVWAWKHNKHGQYTVKSAYHLLNSRQQIHQDKRYKLLWNKDVPLKVAALAWKVIQNRLPTKDN